MKDLKKEMASIRDILGRLQDAIEESKSLHKPEPLKALRKRINGEIITVLKKARGIGSRIEEMDRVNEHNLSLIGLRKKLEELMMDFQELRQKMMSDYREMVRRRYFTVTGENPNEDVIEKIVTAGEEGGVNYLQSAIQEHGRRKVLETVVEIKDRHDIAKEIEKSLLELHQVFLNMTAETYISVDDRSYTPPLPLKRPDWRRVFKTAVDVEEEDTGQTMWEYLCADENLQALYLVEIKGFPREGRVKVQYSLTHDEDGKLFYPKESSDGSGLIEEVDVTKLRRAPLLHSSFPLHTEIGTMVDIRRDGAFLPSKVVACKNNPPKYLVNLEGSDKMVWVSPVDFRPHQKSRNGALLPVKPLRDAPKRKNQKRRNKRLICGS